MSTPDLSVELLPNESVDFGSPELLENADDNTLNRRYVEEGVRIVVEQARYPLNQILAMFRDTYETSEGVKEFKYKRDPEYQRRHRWGPERQSRLIESFLMNVPVPPVFLYEYELARFEVMDGRQRLTALMEFYDDELVLAGLEYWPELNGRSYTTLPTSIRDGIDRRYLSSIILLNETAASEEKAAALKKMVFERLNSGGVRLSSQETRNAVYNGPLNDLCLELSTNMNFRRMLGTPASPSTLPEDDEFKYGEEQADETEDAIRRGGAVGDELYATSAGKKMFESMEDVEMVLRFFAYRHIAEFSQGLNRISDFLDRFLMEGNKFSPNILDAYRRLFDDCIDFWYVVGAETAFKVPGSMRRFSKIAFDALMYASSALSAEQRNRLVAAPDTVREALRQMYSSTDVFGGRKTNAVDARKRNEAALDALSQALVAI